MTTRTATGPAGVAAPRVREIEVPSAFSPRGNKISGTLEWLIADTLVVDPAYERPLNRNRVRNIAENFDPDAFGVLLVSRRRKKDWPGQVKPVVYVLIEGQHRHAAILYLDWGDQRVPCMVYDGLSLDEEAHIFRVTNDGRVRVPPIHMFETRLVEGDPVACGIAKVLKRYNLTVAPGRTETHVTCPTALERAWLSLGPTRFAYMVETFAQAWGPNAGSFVSEVVTGFGLFLAHYDNTLNKKRCAEVLGRRTPRDFLARARVARDVMGGEIGANVAAVILNTYNARLQEGNGRLPDANARVFSRAYAALGQREKRITSATQSMIAGSRGQRRMTAEEEQRIAGVVARTGGRLPLEPKDREIVSRDERGRIVAIRNEPVIEGKK